MTGAAAQMLSDAEARLAQMMDASGLKFGSLTSQQNQNLLAKTQVSRDGGASHAALAPQMKRMKPTLKSVLNNQKI